MAQVLRLVIAAVAGGLLAIVLAYFGVVIVVLVTSGLPLGSDARDPSTGEWVVLLLIGAAAAAAGGRLTARLAKPDAGIAVLALAVSLAATYLWGFTGAGSQWPRWWGPTIAVAAAVGVWFGGAKAFSEAASEPSRDPSPGAHPPQA